METAIAHLGLLEDEAIVLDAAALEIAALDHDGAEIEPYAELLAGMAARVAVLGAQATTTVERARVLARVIGTEFGFTGDSQTYDSPANADLMRVIDRRRGLPVSLTILYVAAARRIGWHADALNTPGHVLTRFGPDPDPVLVDPFHDGRIVGVGDLAALFENALGPEVPPSAGHLAAMSNRTTLVRLLMNQASRAEAEGALDRALVLYRRMTTIAPDHAHPWWDRARLEVAAGDPPAARASLSAMLEVTREPDLRNHVCAALDALARLTR
ncbi:MAG: transglutaminase-like domain-containing protein [Rhizorhabdus sp.]